MELRQGAGALLLLLVSALSSVASAFHGRSLLQQPVTGTIKFADIDIAYTLYDIPKKDPAAQEDIPTAVFLHGQKFNMGTWEQLGTLKRVHAAGIRALAIDLPGFGKTPGLPYGDNNMRSELLRTVLTFAQTKGNSTLHLISPSMSGRYAIPFLDRHGTMLTSWVAIAPVGIPSWGGPWEDTHVRVCMLALYGENDPLLKDSVSLTKLFRNAFQITLPNAGHACYMDQPDLFHTILLKFLSKCHRNEKGEHKMKPDNVVKVEM